ncbi:plasmid mobilization relaxosome protein MobC [Kitasatospora sp. NPDC057965]|uniref:plasmid mobilization relaxosome protein MobC n=1 Tax=Kitasatospora sp. NPDC057965 TaxID=3346291 RepID=UPI0036DE354A
MTAAAADEPSAVRRPRRRYHEPQQRQRKLTVRLSLAEEDEIKTAAAERAQTAARFVAAAALSAARRNNVASDADDRLDRSLDELAAARQQTARVGNNLNQIARELNSGGLPHPADLVAALAAVRTTVTSIDTAAAQLLKGR